MRFTTTQQRLANALGVIEKISIRNFSLPILQNVLLSCRKKSNTLTLSSTDLELGVEVTVPVKVESDGEAAVPSRLLTGLIQNLPAEKVEVSESDKKVTVQCAGHKSLIKGESSEDFPIIPNPSKTNGINVKCTDFLGGINSVVNATAIVDVKPEITGVFTQFKKDAVCFAATDSFRLAEKSLSLNLKNQYLESAIVPKKVCDTLLRIFQNFDGEIAVSLHDNQVIIKSSAQDEDRGRVRFVGRVIDGEYPDYEKIIPAKFTAEIEVDKSEFANHIKTASFFANNINEVILGANAKKQCLEVASNNSERGGHASSLPCRVNGEGERMSFNYRYLLDGVSNVNSASLLIKTNQASSPALIQPQRGDDFRYVVMPIKT